MTRRSAMRFGAFSAGASFVLAVVVAWAVAQGQGPASSNGATQQIATRQPIAQSSLPQQSSLPPTAPLPVAPASYDTHSASDGNLRMTNDVQVYRKVKDAVVNIISSHTVQTRVATGDLRQDLLGGRIVNAQAQSLGSGFVIHSSGYIVTNEHVIDQGTEIECVFSDGKKLPAKVLATDNEHDLAVLKVDAKEPLQAIELGGSEDLMIGEPVYAIGNPFGYAGTMTRGIVSAVNRTIDAGQNKSYKGLIQTDASINPGNSGGPLLNAYGQVVGINTAIRQGAEGIGFAISVSNMRDLLPAFLNPEALNRAQIGFTVDEKRADLPPAQVQASVQVEQVQAGSAAEKAGLKNGDRLITVGTTRVNNVVDALVALANAKGGDALDLQVLRGETGVAGSGNTQEMNVQVAVTQIPLPLPEEALLSRMGIQAETVTPTLIEKFGLQISQGILVDAVKVNSPAAKCGIQPGDVLFQVGRYRVSSVADVAVLLKSVKDPVDAPILIVRGDHIGQGTISLK